MGFCKYCGKKVDDGSVCPECASQRGMKDAGKPEEASAPVQEAPVQPATAEPVTVQPFAAPPVQSFGAGAPAMNYTAPPARRRVNAGVVALLGLLGVFIVFTTIIVAAFT